MAFPNATPELSFLHPEGNGVRILTLDGADARCFSQLVMLEELMRNLEYDYGRSVRPCEFFHSITGVGAAGLIAIMLGILGMTVENASNALTAVCESAFSSDVTDPTTRSKKLALAMENILKELDIPCDIRLETDNNRAAGCLVSICYSSANIAGCRMLRNYKSKHLSYNPTIVEAAQLSWATPGLFSSVCLGPSSRQEELISAVNGFNNPTLEALQEARVIYGENRLVSTVLSLGGGRTSPVGIHSDNLLIKTVQETEITGESMERDFGSTGVYYRFSPEHAIDEEVLTVDGNRLGRIIAYTNSYLERTKTRHAMNRYLKASAYTSSVDLWLRGQAQNADILPEPRPSRSQPSQDELNVLGDLRIARLEYDSPLQGCMEGTRGGILRKIDDWTNDFTAPNILWVKGYPGVGKSAVSTEVVDRLTAVKRLGSAFFFQRQNTALDPKALWRKVSYDLSKKHLPIRKIVFARLNAGEVSPSSSNHDRVFRHYVYEPLAASTEIPDARSPVVVIDALDECGGLEGQNSDHRRILMRCLQTWSSLPHKFKLIITSRGEGDIERLFSGTNHHLIEISAGQTVDTQSSDDIRTFLREQFRYIASQYPNAASNANWPDKETIEQMVIMAAGLFIWAETAIKFIAQGEPRRRLQQVLQGGVDGNITSLYKQILSTSFSKVTEGEIEEFRSIVGTIILAKAPISFKSLSSLLSMEGFSVEHICKGLRSVLEFQTTVRFSHQSFVDFLLDRNKCPAKFFIDPKSESRKLTLACFRVMKEGLRFNICGIDSSYFRNIDIPNIDSKVEKNVQPHLCYACCHWASHLVVTAFDENVFDYLRYFMENLFLYWLEILSVTRAVNQASSMLLSLTRWIRVFDQDNLLKMAVDMQKFVASFGVVISQSAPHIYLSSLPFSPSSSDVLRRYAPRFLQTIKIETGGLKTWPTVQNLLTGHKDAVNSVAFSLDGRHIVSGSRDKTIRIWDTHTGEMVTGPLEGHDDSVYSVAFSPDGRRIVSGSGDGTIRIWDAETSDMVTVTLKEPINAFTISPSQRSIHFDFGDGVIQIHDLKEGKMVRLRPEENESIINAVAFSSDGRRIISGSGDGTIRIWDIGTGKIATFPLEGHKGYISSVAFSPDRSRVVSGPGDNTIQMWDIKTGTKTAGPLEGHHGCICSISLSPDGGSIVSGSSDRTIRIWDTQTGEMTVGPLEGHEDCVYSVAFSTDARRVVSGSGDNTIRIWDALTGEMVAGPLRGHEFKVLSVAFSPDGKHVVSGSWDRTIRIWDTETGEITTSPLEKDKYNANSVAFAPDGIHIVSGSYDRMVRIWDIRTGEMVGHPLEGHSSDVSSASFSPDGRLIVSGSDDSTIRIWDVNTGEMVAGPFYSEGGVLSVSFSPDGRHVVSSSGGSMIQIWDAMTGEMTIDPFEGHKGYVWSVAFSPDGRHVVSGSADETIRIWDSQTGDILTGPLKGHEGDVWSVKFSPDGRRIVSGSGDSTIRIWDVQTGELVTAPLEGHEYGVISVEFSPDGRRIVSGSNDATIRIWDAETGGMVIGPLKGHGSRILSVTISPDGRRIASGSDDRTIRVWDIETGETSTGPLKKHQGHVNSVSFSPDGRYMDGNSFDQIIQIWDDQTNGVATSPPSELNRSADAAIMYSDVESAVFGSVDSISHPPDLVTHSSATENSLSPFFDDSSSMIDGWILGQNSELLFWVPPELRSGLLRPRNTLTMGEIVKTRLNFSSFVHGTSWTQCKTRKPPTNEDILDEEAFSMSLSLANSTSGSSANPNMDRRSRHMKRKAGQELVYTSGHSGSTNKRARLERDIN